MIIRYIRTNRRGPIGNCGTVTCSYVELVEAFGRPNIGLSRDNKVAFGWRLDQCVGSRTDLIEIYPYKATRDYAKDLPSRAALRRLPEFEWCVGGLVNHDALSEYLSHSAERPIMVKR